MTNNNTKMENKVIELIADTLSEGYEGDYSELHGNIFNEDYIYIFTHEAKEDLTDFDVFDAFDKIVEYERDVIGEVVTERFNDPCQIANLLMYILGEEFMNEWEALNDLLDLDDEDANEATPEKNKMLLDSLPTV